MERQVRKDEFSEAERSELTSVRFLTAACSIYIHDKLKSAKEQSGAKKESDPLKDMKPDKDKGARD